MSSDKRAVCASPAASARAYGAVSKAAKVRLKPDATSGFETCSTEMPHSRPFPIWYWFR
jgi:hypothetical protein